MKIFFSGIEELINEDSNPTSTGLAQAQTVFEKVKQRNSLFGMPSSHCRAPGQDSGV